MTGSARARAEAALRDAELTDYDWAMVDRVVLNELLAELDARTVALQDAREALDDYATHGLRCDLHPTRRLPDTALEEYEWWRGYIARADESVRGRARAVLARLDGGA